jgi:hypothetical protein
MLNKIFDSLWKGCRTVVPTPMTVTLREIETRLRTRPYVMVRGALHDEPFEGTFYLVTAVDRKANRLAYFNPYSHANMLIDIGDFKSLSTDGAPTLDLNPNRLLNTLIWQIYKDDTPYKRGQQRRRLAYDWDDHPIYIERGLHVHVGKTEVHDRWGNVAIFEVAALSADRGGPNYEAFSYYAGYGTYGLRVDIGEWEASPRFVDYEQKNRDRLRVEYDTYMASPPFEEGQMIESPHFGSVIFIGYIDATRSAMRVHPGNVIEGITTLMTFKVSENQPVKATGVQEHVGTVLVD